MASTTFDGGAGIMIPTHHHHHQGVGHHLDDHPDPDPDPDSDPTLVLSAGDVKYHLQNVLVNKGEQLEQAATLGQRVLAQQMELEERVRQLQEMEADKGDEEEVDGEARARYRELVETMQAWDAENAQLSISFGMPSRFVNGMHTSSDGPFSDLPREEPDRTKASSVGTSAAQSRRAKNAAHRADDVEFAFEIGSGLLTEVRRLQSLLAERDKAIQDTKEEKDDMDKSIEKLRTALRQQEQSADKFKEENWNLEVTLQELRTQLSDTQADTLRLESEHKRLTKLLSASRDAGDQHKNEAERLKNTLEEMKTKHETDIAQARKHAAGLQRDKSDLQQVVDSMKKEAERAKRLPRFGSPLTPNGPGNEYLTPGTGASGVVDDDVFSVPASTNNRKRYDTSGMFAGEFGEFVDASPDPSPARPFLASNHPSNEIEALQQRLSHAQRQINTLKGTLQREKELKVDLRRKLQGSPGVGEGGVEDEDEETIFEDIESVPKSGQRARRMTPFRSGGKTRGKPSRSSGLTLVQRLAMAPNSPASEFNFEDDVLDGGDVDVDTPPVPPIPIKFQQADEGKEDEDEIHEEEGGLQRSPSPLESLSSSNRVSVDGMDPMFANVLKRANSNASLPYSGSPLRQSVLAASAAGAAAAGSRAGTMGRRRGAAYQEVRPSSLVGQPEALAAELGLGMGMEMETRVEVKEFGIQTEGVEVKEVVVPVVVVLPEKAEMGVQVEMEVETTTIPVPIPTPTPSPPQVVTGEFAVQTDEEPVVIKTEAAVQHAHVEPRPVLVSTSMSTEPEPASIVDLVEVETQTPIMEMSEIDTQTPPSPVVEPIAKADEEVQTDVSSVNVEVWPSMAGGDEDEMRMKMRGEADRRTTITQRTLSLTRLAELSGETTITGLSAVGMRRFLAERAGEFDEDDGEETETGAETETDGEEYHDAPQSAVGMSTPSESLEDFHSVLTMTDNDFSESEDEASIKVSTRMSIAGRQVTTAGAMSAKAPSSSSLIPRRKNRSSFYAASATVSYESKEVSVVPVEEPKPEVKEISTQTDEWVPPPPSSPPLVPGPSLYRIGSGSQQFQFIPRPSSSSGGTSTPLAMPSPTLAVVPVPVPAPVPVPVSSPSSSVFRDSTSTFGARGGRLSQADRRQSIESAMSSVVDESPTRPRVPSGVAAGNGGSLSPVPVDKTKPPMMVLPPPPRLPPPPSSTMMPPPSFIPERKKSQPPPRPSSPPPAELIQRATTPTFGTVLSVGKTTYGRQHGSSMPPSQQGLRQLPSTSSFRSAMNAAAAYSKAQQPQQPQGNLPTFQIAGDKASPRSSISSDRHLYQRENTQPRPPPESPVSQIKPGVGVGVGDTSVRSGAATDPAVIHAITQTMIGEFLYKYTRRPIGKGHGERRHKRFFWVHPYTKTLYWSSADPGSSNVSESSAKSAYIDGVREVLDPNPMPPGLSQYSIVISTPQREMKFTAPTRDRHEIWLNALKYLLSRPGNLPVNSPGNATVIPDSPSSMQGSFPSHTRPPLQSSPQSQRSVNSVRNADSWNTTPRGRNRSQLSVSGSIGKRSGTPAAEYLRWTGPESPYSPDKSFEHITGHAEDDLDFELHADMRSDEGFEGLENVRACCDGRHTVGPTSRDHRHHHHHHPNDHAHNGDHHHHQLAAVAPARPVSPAWSFRSRTASSNSHEGGSNPFFTWGRGEDGRLRFGSRRSAKTVLNPDP